MRWALLVLAVYVATIALIWTAVWTDAGMPPLEGIALQGLPH